MNVAERDVHDIGSAGRPGMPHQAAEQGFHARMRSYRVELVAVAVSVVLSLWLLYWDNVINDDAVLYLKSAEAFARGDWQGAVEIYPWPFYSLVVAATHLATGLNVDSAAYMLGIVLYGVLVWAYLDIARMCGADRRTLWFAALFILLLPTLNDYRTFIIRDIGFWAFYLLGLRALLRFQWRPTLVAAFAWGVAMTIATLFRIEGVVFLFTLPFVVLWRPQSGYPRALMHFAQLQLVLVAGAVVAIIWFAAQGPGAFSGRLLEPLVWAHLFGEQLSSGMLDKAEALREHVLVYYSRDFAMAGVLAILVSILLTYIGKSLGLLGWLAIGYGLAQRAFAFAVIPQRTLMTALAVNIAVLIIFLVPQFFLTGRYVMSLTLTFAVLVPFGLAGMHRRWRDRAGSRARAWLFPAIVLLLAFMAVDSLWSFGASKNYLKEAGLWLRTNTPAAVRLYSGSTVVGFYAQKSGDEWKRSQPPLERILRPDALSRYDYVVVSVARRDALPERLSSVRPVRQFSNRKNDRVLIFRTEDIASANASGGTRPDALPDSNPHL